MKKVGIAIDAWKLPIFEDELEKAGFTFKTGPGVTADTLFLSVRSKTIAEIQPVVVRANDRARREKAENHDS